MSTDPSAACECVQKLGKPGNLRESARSMKTLKTIAFMEKRNDIKERKTASQAYDEGSIPFTRSNIQVSTFMSTISRSHSAIALTARLHSSRSTGLSNPSHKTSRLLGSALGMQSICT